VLVVDDYPDGLEVTCDYLRFCGFRIDASATGRDALDAAITSMPDVIVLDLVLRDVDGLEIIGKLRHHDRTRHIEIVVLTAQVSPTVRTQVIAAGARAFLPKPCALELVALQVAQAATLSTTMAR
jgi:two-component system OmpR family response regulator